MKKTRHGKIRLWMVFALVVVAGLGALIMATSKKTALPTATKAPEQVGTEVKKPSKGFAKQEYTQEEKEEMDSEAYTGAMLTGEGCETIQFDEELRQTCFDTKAYDMALKGSDSRECEKIKNEALKAKCLDQVNFSIALKNQDVGLCDRILDKGVRQDCVNRLLAVSGRTAASAEQCESITDPKLRQSCLDNYHLASVMKTANGEDCALIQDSGLKTRCVQTATKKKEVSQLAKLQTRRTFVSAQKAIQDCGQLAGAQAQQCNDEANQRLAMEKMDVKYCQLVKDADMSSRCSAQVVTARSSFYLQAAVNEKNPTLCEQIPDAALKAECRTYAQ